MQESRLSLYAYLCAHDPRAKVFADATFRTLTDFKNHSDHHYKKATILVAQHFPNVLRFGRIERNSLPDVEEFDDMSLQAGLTKFLQWAEAKRNALGLASAQRILLFSGHGTAGFGFGLRELAAARDPRLDDLMELLGEADQPDAFLENSTWRDTLASEKTLAAFRTHLGSRRLTALLELPPEDQVRALLALRGLRRNARRLETGVTLMAAADDANDVLSVHAFQGIVSSTRITFDVMMLQACALGLVDVAYELREATKALVFCPANLQKSYNIRLALEAVATLPKADFAAKAAHKIVQAEYESRATLGLGGPTALAATNNASVAWTEFLSALDTLKTALLANPSHTRNTFAQLHGTGPQGIRCSEAPTSIGGCACHVVDLLHLAATLGPGYQHVASLLRSTQRQLVRDNDRFEFNMNCRSRGMTMFLPRVRRQMFESYQAGHSDGFELLEKVDWRSVLSIYHPDEQA